jgi:hypothetical protein
MAVNRTSLYESLLLATLVVALTLAAARIYPIWDDARLTVLIRQSGTGVILENFGWRFLVSLVLAFLADHQLFFPVGVIFHFIGWLGMGLVTMKLWRLMFPDYARLALLPGLLSVAPIICKVQLVIVTIVFMELIPSLLSFVTVLLFLTEHPSRRRRVTNYVVGFLLIIFSVLLCEYAVAGAAAGFVILFTNALCNRTQSRRERLLVAMLLPIASLGSYVASLLLATPTANPDFRPAYALESLPRKIEIMPFRLLSAQWRSTIGGVLESLGSINVNSKVALWSFGCGAIFAALVTLVVYKKTDPVPAGTRDWSTVLTLLVATLIAFLPVFLMGRTLESKWDSRFCLPILPVLSSLTVFLLLQLVRKTAWVIIACAFLAGYWTTFEILYAHQHPESVARIKALPMLARNDANKASQLHWDAEQAFAETRLLNRGEN